VDTASEPRLTAPELSALDGVRMRRNAARTAAYLRAISHPVRLTILCRLAEGEARVHELEDLLGIPQAAVSKQLARLREEGIVRAERAGKAVVYSLADDRTRRVVLTLYREFCTSE